MRKLAGVLSDVLEDLTGLREIPLRDTPFDAQCATPARFIGGKRAELRKELEPCFQELPESTVLKLPDILTELNDAVLQIVKNSMGNLSEVQANLILTNIHSAVSVMAVFILGLRTQYDDPPAPDEFRTKEAAAVEGAKLLSRFPEQIALNLVMLFRGEKVMENDDLKDDFCVQARKILVDGIRQNDDHFKKLQKLGYCPAHDGIGEFAATLFHLVVDAYETVYKKAAGKSGVLPEDKLYDLRLEVAYASIAHLL